MTAFVIPALTAQLLVALAGLSLAADESSEPLRADSLPDVLRELPSWGWWTARLLAVNQRLLARSAASLRSALQVLMSQVSQCSPMPAALLGSALHAMP